MSSSKYLIHVGLFAAMITASTRGADITLTQDNTSITESARVPPGRYLITDIGDDGVVQIVGDDLTVDFQGAELVGATEEATADSYVGRGIVIRGNNVTLKNAKIRGYKVGIYAEDSPNLTLENCDVSRNCRQRLKSTPQREDLADWLFGHENDNNEWLRYGSGIYLFNCPKATVKNNRSRNGQNGICLVRCDESAVFDNDMSFMSGWGLALWRTSRCDVSNNKFDWCIRGYSHGVYSRGQDSTGILVYEQCNDNIFAFNSATHGGDGFFLYAGNETLHKTGTGGCNRNLLYKNDFSHAAANGIEATFSDGNAFVENVLNECEHGVWAGYSTHTLIVGNSMHNCRNGVSIEHGRDNVILGNCFQDCDLGIHLWWDNDPDLLSSTFGRHHDECPSKDNLILGNEFWSTSTGIRLVDNESCRIQGNDMHDLRTALHLKGKVADLMVEQNRFGAAAVVNDGIEVTGKMSIQASESAGGSDTAYMPPDAWKQLQRGLPPKVHGTQTAFLAPAHPRGRRYIFVDEWGPYDFTDARIFPSTVAGGDRATFNLLGPSGNTFKFLDARGDVEVSPHEGALPGTITVAARKPGVHPFSLNVAVAGERLAAKGTLVRADWSVRFFKWDAASDPREHQDAWDALLQQIPLEDRRVSALDFVWGGGAPSDKVPADHFGTVAETTLPMPVGSWRIRTVSDDGIRVWIDEQKIIDNWTWHPPTEDTTTLTLPAGEHKIRIEHFEIDGHAQLQFFIEPGYDQLN